MALVAVGTEVAVRHILAESVMAEAVARDKVHLCGPPLTNGLRPFLITDIPVGVMSACCTQVDLPMVRSPDAKRLPTLRRQFKVGSFRVWHNRNSRESSTQQNMTGKLTGEYRFIEGAHIAVVEAERSTSGRNSQALERPP